MERTLQMYRDMMVWIMIRRLELAYGYEYLDSITDPVVEELSYGGANVSFRCLCQDKHLEEHDVSCSAYISCTGFVKRMEVKADE